MEYQIHQTTRMWSFHKDPTQIPALVFDHIAQYVNWNKHPVPVPPSSRLIHYESQHSCVTSCRKSWCESCWYSCNCEGPPIKIHFSIDLSNCYNVQLQPCNHVYMWLPIPLKPCNLAFKLVFDTERLWLWASRFLTKQNAKEETVKIME